MSEDYSIKVPDEEPFPLEFFYDWTDSELERLVCDCLDELKRRAQVILDLERGFAA